jgi:hypothetical protein
MHPTRTTNFDTALDLVAQRLARHVSEGARPVCYLPGNAGRIDAVERWIFDQPQRLQGVDLFQVLALGPAAGWQRAVMGGVGIVTPFIGPGVRDLVNAGLARNIRCNLSQVPRLFEGRWRPQVAFAHTSPPDAEGRVTLGLNAGIDFAPVRQAMFKVAMVNAQMPRWHIATHDDPATGQRIDSGCAMKLADFDLVVEIDEPLFEHHMAPVSPVHETQTRAIARTIVDLLHRRAAPAADATALPHTIQLGIGKIPNAVANELVAHGLVGALRVVGTVLRRRARAVPRRARPGDARHWPHASRAHRRRLRARQPGPVRDDAREPGLRRAAAGDRQRPGAHQAQPIDGQHQQRAGREPDR